MIEVPAHSGTPGPSNVVGHEDDVCRVIKRDLAWAVRELGRSSSSFEASGVYYAPLAYPFLLM